MAKDTTRRRLGEHLELLPVKLTDEEWLDRAKKAAAVREQLQQHLLETSAIKQRLKAKEEELNEQFAGLMHNVGAGTEPREVKVEAWANFATNTFEELRTDTEQVINKRRLRAEERQGEFDAALWGEQLHLRLVQEMKEREDIAKKRAGDVEKDEDEP